MGRLQAFTGFPGFQLEASEVLVGVWGMIKVLDYENPFKGFQYGSCFREGAAESKYSETDFYAGSVGVGPDAWEDPNSRSSKWVPVKGTL